MPPNNKNQKAPSKVNPLARAAAQNRALATAVSPMPDFLVEKTVVGVEDLSKYVILPRLKIVQKQASRDLLDSFRVGSCIIHPNGLQLADIELDPKSGQPIQVGEPFLFTPLFFFEEWCIHNPVGTAPFIRSRSLDPRSELATKARDPARRKERIRVDGQADIEIRYVEHLNFVCLVMGDHPLAQQRLPFIISFFRGSHGGGRRLSSLIKARHASPFACIFEGQTEFTTDGPNDWYRLNVANPPDGVAPWVTETEYADFEKLHLDFKETHSKNRLSADYSDSIQEEAEADAGPAEL